MKMNDRELVGCCVDVLHTSRPQPPTVKTPAVAPPWGWGVEKGDGIAYQKRIIRFDEKWEAVKF